MRTALAAALIGLAASAQARLPISDKTTNTLAVQAIHNYGACAAERTPRAARAILAMDYRTKEYGERMKRFAEGHGYCAPGSSLAFDGVLFAGAVAEQLLESGRRPDQIPALLAIVPNPPLEARSETEMMALCTVRTAPAEAASLFKQPVGSKEEIEAFKAIGPKLVACLGKDQKLEINRPGLRSVLALAAWRIASAGGID